MVKQNRSIDVSYLSSNLPEMWALLDAKGRADILSSAKILEFKKNKIIYYEGETPKDLMCLLKGKVKIFKKGASGRSQIIRVIRPVQNFGYRAYFANEPYVTSATAFEPSTICFIPMELIERLVLSNSRFALFFIRDLAIDLGIADERVVTLTQKHIRGRMAEALIFLIDNYGLEEDGATISIYLSREDLGSLSNMTTSNAIRTLGIFMDEHIVALDGRKIKVIDIERLRKISKIG